MGFAKVEQGKASVEQLQALKATTEQLQASKADVADVEQLKKLLVQFTDQFAEPPQHAQEAATTLVAQVQELVGIVQGNTAAIEECTHAMASKATTKQIQ